MSQKTDTMIKLALVFTVSLLSFSVGTYVGKMYSDNQHKLAQLEPQAKPAADHQEFATEHGGTEATPAEKALDTVTPGGETALTDSEVAKIAEEFATSDESVDEKPIGTTVANTEKEIKTIPAKAAGSTVGSRPVANAASAKSLTTPAIDQLKKMEADQRQPASIPAKKEITPNSSIHFTIQVGSFPTDAEAQKLTKDLLSKGFKTSIVPAQVNGQTWFRVNVGTFGTVKEAQDYKKDFLAKTQLASAFVQKVQ